MTAEDRATLDRAADILLERAEYVRTYKIRENGADLDLTSEICFKRYCDALDAHIAVRRVLLERAP